MYFRVFLISLLLFFSNTLQSQEVKSYAQIKGKVEVVANGQLEPVAYPTVRLLSPTDSALVVGVVGAEDGVFKIRIERNKEFLLAVSSMGYDVYYQNVKVEGKLQELVLQDILMNEKSFSLAEAVVVGRKAEMSVKTDTLEYSASAYKLRDNAVAEDMLKRMPGITITEEGKILVNGKEVKRVMVDGKDFFRSNPNLTIKNIPASIMDKLQIIDDKSELSKLTGVDDGEEEIAINITIQKEKKRGWLVSNNLGLGQELNSSEGDLMRYTVNSFAARLVEDSQLGIVMNGNNINGMSIGGGGSTVGSGKPGLNSSFSVGVNFSSGKEKVSPWLINSDLSYGFNERVLRRSSIRQYFIQDSVSYQTDTLFQTTRDQGLRFNAKVENRSLKGWVFSVNPSASYTTNFRNDIGNSTLQAGNANRDTVNANRYSSGSTTPSLNLGLTLTVSHEFEKKGRRASLNIDSKYENNDGEGQTNALYTYYRNNRPNSQMHRDQQWFNGSTGYNNRLYFSYIEPIAEKHSLQLVYWFRSNNRLNLVNNYKPDPITGEYTDLDEPFSRSLDNTINTQQIGLSYRGAIRKVAYTLGLDYNPSTTDSRIFIQNGSYLGGDSTITYFPSLHNFNYAPNAYLMYSIGKGKSIRFDYRGRSTSPSVSQLDPSRNETNPTNIRVGNPNLLPKFNHWSRMRLNLNNRALQQSIQLNIEGNYVMNDIVNYTEFDANTGIRTTSPVNKSGSWNLNGTFLFARPLGNHFQINNNTLAGVKNNIGYTSVSSKAASEENIATTRSINEELGLSYKNDWFYMMTKFVYQYNSTDYSINSILPKKNSSIGGFINPQLTLPKSWVLSSVLNFRQVYGFSEEYTKSELLWNIEISKSVFKHKAGTISLVVNDILQQQLNFTQVVASNYVEDQQFNTLKSFVMLSFTYKFNSLGKG